MLFEVKVHILPTAKFASYLFGSASFQYVVVLFILPVSAFRVLVMLPHIGIIIVLFDFHILPPGAVGDFAIYTKSGL